MTNTSDNTFSISRAIAYSRMFPALKQHLAIYTTGAFILFSTAMLISTTTAGIFVGSIFMSIISLAMYLGPLVFAIGSCPMAEVMFPATKNEKAAMMTLYTFVVIPAAIAVAALLATLFARIFVDGVSICDILPSGHQLTFVYSPLQYAGALLPTSVCLLSVVSYRRRRVLMPIVWTIVCLIATSVTAGIIAIVAVLGFKNEFINSIDRAAPDKEEIARIMHDFIMPVMCWYIALAIIAMVALTILAVRKIRNRQL